MSLRRLICHTFPKNREHEVVICVIFEQVRIHDRISRKHWAGALMEVRSLFCLNLTHGPTDIDVEDIFFQGRQSTILRPNENVFALFL